MKYPATIPPRPAEAVGPFACHPNTAAKHEDKIAGCIFRVVRAEGHMPRLPSKVELPEKFNGAKPKDGRFERYQRILIQRGPMRTTEIAAALHVSQASVSYAMRHLRAAGIVWREGTSNTATWHLT